MSADFLLYEAPVGYAIFKVVMKPDTVGNRLKEVQQKSQDLAHFGKMVKIVSFAAFESAQQALENINEISEGIVSDYLHTALETNLPKPGKTSKVTLGVSDRGLAGSIKEAFPGIQCETSETSEVIADLLRGLRLHAPKLLAQFKSKDGSSALQDADLDLAQRGLGHSYSRSKVKFNINRNDNHIIQAISSLDHSDKTVNTLSMRLREWYSWHFPELVKIVSENHQFARLALFIGDKRTLSDDRLHELAAAVNDDLGIAQSIMDASKVSMGRDVSEDDMKSLMLFASRVVSAHDYRKKLSGNLVSKMGVVAPNLAALIGETVGARLISHAGSLTNLAKYPASTIQILGAEKALFRALKTKGNTPKYGLIYHSSFIGRAGTKNKGRISRFLANKCSMASRIDNFAEEPSTVYGDALKKQVEERLEFYASGAIPTKNADAMKAAMDTALKNLNVSNGDAVVPAIDTDMDDILPNPAANKATKSDGKKSKKDKKKKDEGEIEKDKKNDKKRKHEEDVVAISDQTAEGTQEKKKKKKEKHKHGKE